jgi:hypothetical protein
VLIKITPEKAGTFHQSQGIKPRSRRVLWCACATPIVTTKLFVQYPASGDRAARVFYSQIQVKPQSLSIKGGLLRNSQEDHLTAVRKQAFYAGTQSIIFHKLEEMNE